jgi:hypothetical protein
LYSWDSVVGFGEVFAADGGVGAGGGFQFGEGKGELALEGDALEAELTELLARGEEVAHVHPAAFEACGHFLHGLGNGIEGLGIEGTEAGFKEGNALQARGEGVLNLQFRGMKAGAGFVAKGCSFLDEAILLIPNGEGNRDGEAEEVVGAEPLGFIHVAVVGVLDP